MNNFLLKLGKNYKSLVFLSTDVSEKDFFASFAKYFPERFFCFGLAEGNMISVAAGFALAKKIPVVVGKGDFLLTRAFEQIYNDICLPNLNVKMITFASGNLSQDLVKLLPNIKIANGGLEQIEEMVLEYGPGYVSCVW